jgi:hypothetical protein
MDSNGHAGRIQQIITREKVTTVTKILIFAVEVEDNETPEIGEAYDVTNDDRYFIDARLATIIPSNDPNLPDYIKEIL